MSLHRTVLVAFSLLLSVPAAWALTVDDFEGGAFTLTDPGTAGSTSAEQSGLPGTFRGVRMVQALATGAVPVAANAALVETPADDGVLMSAAPSGLFIFHWDGSANGVANGRNGSLNLDLSSFTSLEVNVSVPVPGPTLELTIWNTGADQTTGPVAAADGLNSFALSIFTGVNLDAIRALRLTIDGVTGPISLFDVSTNFVPEPGSALLLGMGLAALGAARRRRGAWRAAPLAV